MRHSACRSAVPPREAEVHSGVEHGPVTRGRGHRGVEEPGVRHEPGKHGEVAAVAPERPPHGLPMGAARARAEQRGPGGQRAGGDGVVDALPGERVHQRRRIPNQQHPPVGMVTRTGRKRQVVAADGARVGRLARQQPIEGGEQLAPRSAAPPVEHAEPDVRAAVGQGERPRVGGVAAAGELDHQLVRPNGDRCVAPDRDGHGARRRGRGPGQPADDRVRAVGADHDAGGEPLVEHHPVGLDAQRPHAVAAQQRAPGHCRVDEAGVEDGPRNRMVGAGTAPGDDLAAGAAQPQTGHGRAERSQVGHAQRVE